MKVTLITHTPEPEKLIAGAANLCYSPKEISEILEDLSDSNIQRLVTKLADMGHESPFEHISFTFGIEGVSRSLTHQLVRHRIGSSYSQKSQRYVKEGSFEYVVPPEISKDKMLKQCYEAHMKLTSLMYEHFVSVLIREGRTEKQAIEDARYILPNACETKIVVTMNARALFNFFSKRCCNRAQWEIRNLADEMLRLVREVAPTVFRNAGAPCTYGSCPEGNMTCGNPRR